MGTDRHRQPDLSAPVNRQVTTATPWLTRRIWRWAMFDVASSTYIALVPTLFGLYFMSLALIAPPRLLEIVPSPPKGHRRWHLRQWERRCKAIERARAVWEEHR